MWFLHCRPWFSESPPTYLHLNVPEGCQACTSDPGIHDPRPQTWRLPSTVPTHSDSLALHLLTGKNPEPHLDLQCLWICLCVTISMTVPLQVASGQPHRGRSAPLVPSFHMAASVALVEVLLYMSPMHQCSCPPTDSKRSLDTP